MDPAAAFREMIAAYRDDDYERTVELAEGLLQWLARGGYVPAPYDATRLRLNATVYRDSARYFGRLPR